MTATHAHADTASGLAQFQRGAFAEAQLEWREAAHTGNAAAALYMGVSFDAGEGVASDPAQAADWYRQAAQLGSVVAMFNLAVLYDAGHGVARDPAAAASWYRRAAERGYPRAEYNLGLIHEADAGRPPHRTQAIRWFRLALRDGITAARGHLIALGAGLPPVGQIHAEDPGLRAFEQAQAALLHRQPDELRRAVELFRESAGHDNPLAAYDLGYCYENALGVPADLTQAYHWYQRAAAIAGDAALRAIASSSVDRLARQLTPASLRQAQAAP